MNKVTRYRDAAQSLVSPIHPVIKNSYLHQAILKRIRADRLASVHGLRDNLGLVSLYEHNMLDIHVNKKGQGHAGDK